MAAITADARRYGFHATLRAPFHPADGVDIARIIAAAQAFGAARKPFDLSLEVANHKGFLALTPVQAPAALGVLEADLLAHFDALVRPPSPDELARRRQANLNPAQDAHLRRWGYPYVLDQFHFHMTLTARLSDPAELATLFDALRARAAPVLAEPLRIDAIAVFVEAEKGSDFKNQPGAGAGRPTFQTRADDFHRSAGVDQRARWSWRSPARRSRGDPRSP